MTATTLHNTRSVQAGTKRSEVPGHRTRRRGFSLTELLVVIGIIVLLAAILLVALGQVRASALETTTMSTMRGFAAACDSFQQEHGEYPGVIPERVLAQAIADGDEDAGRLSSTQNALLHLMGGYRVLRPNYSTREESEYVDFVDNATDLVEFEITAGEAVWQLAVDLARIGEGPYINGQSYAPYFTPGSREIGVPEGRWSVNEDDAVEHRLPSLIDAWGQPILYTRRMRSSGPLVGDMSDTDVRPQFAMEGMQTYLLSPLLGELGETQIYSQSPHGSILTFGKEEDQHRLFAQIIRHPAFGPNAVDLVNNFDRFSPRGEYVLISAGRDGIYFSATDGPGSRQSPLFSEDGDPDFQSVDDLLDLGPTIFEEFNDLVIFGGG